MNIDLKRTGKYLPKLIILFCLFGFGCSLEKESGFNRAMQNLTAHYNILFNANQLLQQKQDAYALGFVDNYNDLLRVYQDTTAQGGQPDKELDSVVIKANNIISLKEQSHYIGDAYLLMGKAAYLGGNYFNAVEYFSYDIRSYPAQLQLVQEARVWKARSLLNLKQLPQAKGVLDTAEKNINPKKNITADVYATLLQYNIDVEEYPAAEDAAANAVKFAYTKKLRLRWRFILAQLQELNHKQAEAYKNYTAIMNSNASFEMAFNASLNRIRIAENQGNDNKGRLAQLLVLLKNQNNLEFKDQIYFQIGEYYAAKNDLDNAVKYYKLAIRNSIRNQAQKGLAYLRIADINFKNKADYITAKKYYDSTLTALPPTYPGYIQLQKKTNNLQLLVDRLQTIAREDTLQMLAKLNEADRKTKIDAMVNAFILNQQALAAANAAPALNNSAFNANSSSAASGGKSSFYFYNSAAISQGFNDFKRKWGNRKLEDNWRISSKAAQAAAAINPTNASFAAQSIDPDAQISTKPSKSAQNVNAENYRRQIMDGLPLSPQRLEQSNDRIYAAYLDIANFYRDILNDRKEAIAVYLLLLKRFPDRPDQAAILYNLYRLYADDGNPEKASEYRERLLKGFPETPYARIILDPEYAKKLDDKDAEFNGLYNNVYDEYAHRKYKQVIDDADVLLKQYPNNKLAAQLAYLKAMAAGHNEKLTPFQADLQNIATQYPEDRLIAPLVNQHLAYIKDNQTEMAARPVVLTDDTTEDKLVVPPVPTAPPAQVYRTAQIAGVPTTGQKPAISVPQSNQPAAINPQNINRPYIKPITAQTITAPASSIFSMADSTNFVFVVNVSTSRVNLASSRFGIGQFNRANYQGKNIRHQAMFAGPDNQLIYVGRFYSLGEVKAYARAIIPLMPDIMKVPADKYSFFIITKQNLDKLADKKTLDSYVDYYQQNYLK